MYYKERFIVSMLQTVGEDYHDAVSDVYAVVDVKTLEIILILLYP